MLVTMAQNFRPRLAGGHLHRGRPAATSTAAIMPTFSSCSGLEMVISTSKTLIFGSAEGRPFIKSDEGIAPTFSEKGME